MLACGVGGTAVLGVGGTVADNGPFISWRVSVLPSVLLERESAALVVKSAWLLIEVGWRIIVETFGFLARASDLPCCASPGAAGAGMFSLSFCSESFDFSDLALLLPFWRLSAGNGTYGDGVRCWL